MSAHEGNIRLSRFDLCIRCLQAEVGRAEVLDVALLKDGLIPAEIDVSHLTGYTRSQYAGRASREIRVTCPQGINCVSGLEGRVLISSLKDARGRCRQRGADAITGPLSRPTHSCFVHISCVK